MTCVLDWNNVCIVCLQKAESRCIFENEPDSDILIADKIMKCSDFSINKSPEQPDNICLQCLDELNVAYKFRQNCEQSNSIIKAILSKDNRELEVSGLRIKIPSGLKVKKVHPESSKIKTIDDCVVHDEPNEIKDEDEKCKTSSECENFDSNDYIESADVLEDNIEELEETEQAEQVKDFDPMIEEVEKLEAIPEESEAKLELKTKPKRSSVAIGEKPVKRGRGRPRKMFNIKNDPNYQPEVTYQQPSLQKRKNSSEAKPHKICEICGNSYKYQHALNSHMRRHRNERPFNCEFCDKAFVSAVELRRHMRVHTGQKPYECQYCERRFSDYGSRIKHERTHTGERPYVCLTCGKSFAYAHVLTVHLRTHTGEKKYSCNVCRRGFTKKAYLDNHLTNQHTRRGMDEVLAQPKTEEFDVKMEIDRYVILPMTVNGRLKPKEERCEDDLIQEDYHSLEHDHVDEEMCKPSVVF